MAFPTVYGNKINRIEFTGVDEYNGFIILGYYDRGNFVINLGC